MSHNDILLIIWRKSTHSGGSGSDCVEVATLAAHAKTENA
ncbi:MAG: DUF397 domain-containing protein [Actinoallomurus sp.]